MGVMTTAYSTPFDRIGKIRAYKSNLNFPRRMQDSNDAARKLEDCDFAKGLRALLRS